MPYVFRIEQDEYPESPREWDNLGKMVCWHRRYSLGDEQPSDDPEDWLYSQASSYTKKEADDFESKAEAWSVLDKQWIYLPLYLYDHSGITMNTTGFSCRWDSGQVGWIYVEKARVLKDFGWKRLTKHRIAQVCEYLESEVGTYDQYLTGDVYRYFIDEVDDAGNVISDGVESCGGFYGKSYAEEDAASMIASLMKYERNKTAESFHYALAAI